MIWGLRLSPSLWIRSSLFTRPFGLPPSRRAAAGLLLSARPKNNYNCTYYRSNL